MREFGDQLKKISSSNLERLLIMAWARHVSLTTNIGMSEAIQKSLKTYEEQISDDFWKRLRLAGIHNLEFRFRTEEYVPIATENKEENKMTNNENVAAAFDEAAESNRKSVANTLDILRETLGKKVMFERGTVIRFKSRSRSYGTERDYDYVAIFAGDSRWYLSGKNKYYGDGLTSAEFLKILSTTDDIHAVELATTFMAV